MKKKASRNTRNKIFCQNMRRSLQETCNYKVSLCSRARQRQRNAKKKCAARAKLLLFLLLLLMRRDVFFFCLRVYFAVLVASVV